MATQPLFSFDDAPAEAPTEPVAEASPQDELAAALVEMRQRLTKTRKTNEGKYRAILAQGATPSPIGILAARLDALLELALSPEARLAFDLAFEDRMTGVLNECLANLREQRVQLPPGAARQSGLIVP